MNEYMTACVNLVKAYRNLLLAPVALLAQPLEATGRFCIIFDNPVTKQRETRAMDYNQHIKLLMALKGLTG